MFHSRGCAVSRPHALYPDLPKIAAFASTNSSSVRYPSVRIATTWASWAATSVADAGTGGGAGVEARSFCGERDEQGREVAAKHVRRHDVVHEVGLGIGARDCDVRGRGRLGGQVVEDGGGGGHAFDSALCSEPPSDETAPCRRLPRTTDRQGDRPTGHRVRHDRTAVASCRAEPDLQSRLTCNEVVRAAHDERILGSPQVDVVGHESVRRSKISAVLELDRGLKIHAVWRGVEDHLRALPVEREVPARGFQARRGEATKRC